MNDVINWDIFLSPLKFVFYILSLPVRILTVIVVKIRTRRYNPEKVTCPGCGYRGERSGNYNTCTIRFTLTSQKTGSVQHSCLRCSAEYYSASYLQCDKWIGQTLDRRKQEIANKVL